jgi:hypothetical protein
MSKDERIAAALEQQLPVIPKLILVALAAKADDTGCCQMSWGELCRAASCELDEAFEGIGILYSQFLLMPAEAYRLLIPKDKK